MDIWKVRGRFPTSEEMSRMVAAEVRARVESTIAQEKAAEEVRIKRRDRLREAYRKHNICRWICDIEPQCRSSLQGISGISFILCLCLILTQITGLWYRMM
jgi:hypothetical protein